MTSLRHIEHFYSGTNADTFLIVLDTHCVRMTHEQANEMVAQYLDKATPQLCAYSNGKPVRQPT